MVHWLYYVCLFVVLLLGLAITIMTLPGLWLMLAAAAIYAWLTGGAYIGWWTLAALLVLAVTGEVVELASSGAGAKRAGAGRRGLWGALIGGVLGGIFLSFIPIPVLSTLVGVCLGTFLGATIGELSGGRHVGHSALIGLSATKGRLVGTFQKLGLGCVMFVITMLVGLPIGRHKTPGPANSATTTTAPATAPASQPG
ncbi:MAG TPA: DUF456 domain-containing protein [Tepidisphaeraceae bacterium]|nr:DUF456 domain-containing protein [Tepidisphaeraceae bacterium]